MPRWPNSAVAARNDRSCAPAGGVRTAAMPTWEPMNSGGTQLRRPALDGAAAPAGRCSRETQTRSVRSRTPRSTRAPPEEQDSISRPGCRRSQLVDAAGRRPRSGRARPGGRRRAGSGVDQVAVVVPLDVVDAVLRRAAPSICVEDVVVGLRDGQVEHLLVARLDRAAGRPGGRIQSGCARARSESALTISGSNHRPNCMPSARTRSTSGCRPFGQTSCRHDPVAQAGPVVAAAAEPAVVEHEALDADLGGPLGQRQSAGPGRGRSRPPPRRSG